MAELYLNIKMKHLLVLLLIFIASCAIDEVNISQLSGHDKSIFKQSAKIEDVEIVPWLNPWTWIVVYRDLSSKKSGKTESIGEYVVIYLS